MAKQTKSSAGGGVNSNKVRKVGLKTGGPNRAMSPCAVAQIGGKIAHARAVEKLDAGKALSPPLGNELVTNVNGGGPGKGRTLHGQSGMQSVHSGSPRKVEA